MSENNYMPLFWGIVELFGHNVIAGEVGEQIIGGETFIRVDVPEIDDQKSFTKFFGKGAIYAIAPCDDLTAQAAVSGVRAKPIEVWKLHLPQLEEPEKKDNDIDEELDW